MQCFGLGTFDGIPFEFFAFPKGNYFSLEHPSILFFKENRAKLLSYLSAEQMSQNLLQDVQSKSIYISTDAMKAVSENVGSVQMSALANLTQQAIMKGAALAIVSAIERLEPVNSPEESTMSISVQPYVFERRYGSRHSSGQEQSQANQRGCGRESEKRKIQAAVD